MKDILIIGGSYFAGRVFVEGLTKKEEYNIFVFNRGRVPLGFAKVTELVGDRNVEEQIREVIPQKGWYAVVDFCAYSPDHVEKLIRSIPGNVAHYILISTTSIYEDSVILPINEDAAKLSRPQPELGEYANYGFDKWRAERKAVDLCFKKEIPYTILRPAIIYGKYNYAPRETYFFELIEQDKPVVIPENDLPLFSFLWVVDLARIIFRCMHNESIFNYEFNACSPELISYRRLIEVLEEIIGKQIRTMRMGIDEIYQKGFPLPFPLDKHLIYSGSRIAKALEFQYTPFLEGMRGTYNYFKWAKQSQKA